MTDTLSNPLHRGVKPMKRAILASLPILALSTVALSTVTLSTVTLPVTAMEQPIDNVSQAVTNKQVNSQEMPEQEQLMQELDEMFEKERQEMMTELNQRLDRMHQEMVRIINERFREAQEQRLNR
jgi:hypothetical protein